MIKRIMKRTLREAKAWHQRESTPELGCQRLHFPLPLLVCDAGQPIQPLCASLCSVKWR